MQKNLKIHWGGGVEPLTPTFGTPVRPKHGVDYLIFIMSASGADVVSRCIAVAEFISEEKSPTTCEKSPNACLL